MFSFLKKKSEEEYVFDHYGEDTTTQPELCCAGCGLPESRWDEPCPVFQMGHSAYASMEEIDAALAQGPVRL